MNNYAFGDKENARPNENRFYSDSFDDSRYGYVRQRFSKYIPHDESNQPFLKSASRFADVTPVAEIPRGSPGAPIKPRLRLGLEMTTPVRHGTLLPRARLPDSAYSAGGHSAQWTAVSPPSCPSPCRALERQPSASRRMPNLLDSPLARSVSRGRGNFRADMAPRPLAFSARQLPRFQPSLSNQKRNPVDTATANKSATRCYNEPHRTIPPALRNWRPPVRPMPAVVDDAACVPPPSPPSHGTGFSLSSRVKTDSPIDTLAGELAASSSLERLPVASSQEVFLPDDEETSADSDDSHQEGPQREWHSPPTRVADPTLENSLLKFMEEQAKNLHVELPIADFKETEKSFLNFFMGLWKLLIRSFTHRKKTLRCLKGANRATLWRRKQLETEAQLQTHTERLSSLETRLRRQEQKQDQLQKDLEAQSAELAQKREQQEELKSELTEKQKRNEIVAETLKKGEKTLEEEKTKFLIWCAEENDKFVKQQNDLDQDRQQLEQERQSLTEISKSLHLRQMALAVEIQEIKKDRRLMEGERSQGIGEWRAAEKSLKNGVELLQKEKEMLLKEKAAVEAKMIEERMKAGKIKEDILNENEILNNTVKELTRMKDDLLIANKSLETNVEELESQKHKSEDERKMLQGEKIILTTERDALVTKNHDVTARVTTLEQEILSVRNSGDNLKVLAEDLKSKAETLEKEKESFKTESERLRHEAELLNEKAERQNAAIKSLEKEKDLLNKGNAEYKIKIEHLEKEQGPKGERLKNSTEVLQRKSGTERRVTSTENEKGSIVRSHFEKSDFHCKNIKNKLDDSESTPTTSTAGSVKERTEKFDKPDLERFVRNLQKLLKRQRPINNKEIDSLFTEVQKRVEADEQRGNTQRFASGTETSRALTRRHSSSSRIGDVIKKRV